MFKSLKFKLILDDMGVIWHDKVEILVRKDSETLEDLNTRLNNLLEDLIKKGYYIKDIKYQVVSNEGYAPSIYVFVWYETPEE